MKSVVTGHSVHPPERDAGIHIPSSFDIRKEAQSQLSEWMGQRMDDLVMDHLTDAMRYAAGGIVAAQRRGK